MMDQLTLNLPFARTCPACQQPVTVTYTVICGINWVRGTVTTGEVKGMQQEAHSCGPNSNIAQIIERGA